MFKLSSLLTADYLKEFTLKGNGRRKYNIFSQHDNSQSAKKLFPAMTYADHLSLAKKFFALKNDAQSRYEKSVDDAFMANLGRKPLAGDYKISGIWSDEFPEEWKNILRSLCSEIGDYSAAYGIHASRLLIKDKRDIESGNVIKPENKKYIGMTNEGNIMSVVNSLPAETFKDRLCDMIREHFVAADCAIISETVVNGDYEYEYVAEITLVEDEESCEETITLTLTCEY